MKCVGGPYPAAAKLARDLVSDPIRLASLDKGDDAAAEAASGHSCAEGAGGAGHFDRQINLRHRDLEVVPHGLVRRVEERREISDAARPQDRDGLQHPGVLGNHMAYPAAHHRIGQLRQRSIQISHVAQRRHTEQPGGFLAAGSTGCVLAVDQRMRRLRIEDEYFQAGAAGVEENLLGCVGAAVEEQRMAGGAQGRGGLIHQARSGLRRRRSRRVWRAWLAPGRGCRAR